MDVRGKRFERRCNKGIDQRRQCLNESVVDLLEFTEVYGNLSTVEDHRLKIILCHKCILKSLTRIFYGEQVIQDTFKSVERDFYNVHTRR